MEIWSSQYAVMMELIAQTGVSPAEIAAIGITNQRETTIIWEKATGRPVYHAIVGLTRGTRREHIIRAAQESIAYQVADLVHAMEADTGLPLGQLKADGGASRDAFLMQFQADILDREVRRPAIRETTALGAAYLAGLAAGVWSGTGELRRLWRCDTAFSPAMPPEQRERLLEQWHRAVGRSRDWAR